MTIPIIILNYNTSADCRKCVSFLKQQEGVNTEIILVDNCSKEESLIALRVLAAEQGCTLIENKENRGYNAGNNIGLRYAAKKGYEYALIANPDMEFPQTDYLLCLVDKLLQDSSVVVVASDIVGLDGLHQNPMFRDGDWRGCFGWLTSLLKKIKADTYDFIDNYTESHYCSKVSGCCFLIRLNFVQSIGYLDENVFLYCEEAILSRQTEQKGFRMYYLADKQVVHAHVKNEKGDPVKRFKHWKRSRLYFIDTYSGDCWFGREIAKLSMRMYVGIFSIIMRIKKML